MFHGYTFRERLVMLVQAVAVERGRSHGEASGQTPRSVPPGGSPPTTSRDAALSRRDRPRTAEPFVALCRNCGGEIERGVLLPYRHVNGRPRGSVNHYARPRRP